MTITILENQKGKVDRDALLGRLMWYSVPENTMLHHEEVVKKLTELGLDKALPSYPEDYNVFRRVSKKTERRKVQRPGNPNEFENWMIRDVASRGEDIITRRIVVEVVDPKGRRLNYEQVADVEFDRNLKRINFVWLNGCNEYSHPTAKEMMAELQVEYFRWRGQLNDQAIREWLRRSVLAMGATPVRPSGGVYFLEESHADKVEALEQFVADTLPAGGECHSVQIPDNDKQREMVRRAIESETTGAIEAMLTEIAKVKKEGRLTPKRYLELLAEVSALESKMNGYSKLLEKDLGSVSSRLQLLHMQTKSLSNMQGRKPRTKKNG